MKCMKKVALEFDEDNINRHPEGAEDGKGGQFAPKDGGSGHSFSEPKEINKEELDEDSDYRKDNPVKEDNVIRMGDPDEEWYEKLEIGKEYTQLSHIRDYFDSRNYEQHFEGYNLFTRFDIKNKGYEDESDKTIGQLVKLYDDNGKLITEQRTGKDTGEFIISEKRLDENGEMTEIEYTDEEHGKNMRNFVPKYDKNYKDQREKWDKNEKEKGKIKEFMIEGKEIEDLKKEKRSINSEIIKLNGKIDSAENDDEIRKYQDEILEINKKSGEIEEKIKEAKLNKKNDSHVQANMQDIAEVMNHIHRMKDGYNDINKFSRDELLSVAKSKLDDHDVKKLEKFLRMSDRVEVDIKEGNIETMGKFGKNEYDEHSFVEMANSEIRNNKNLQKAEIAYKKYKTNLKSRELLYNEGDEYLENEFSFVLAVVNLQDKYGLDEDTRERLRKEATPQKPVKDMNEQEKETYRKNMDTYNDYVKKEGKPTEREQKLLDDEKEYAKVNKDGLKYVGENLEMHKNRIGNEVFTPLTAKNVHIYSVGDIEQDVKEHLYKKAKDFFPKNRWVKQSVDVDRTSYSSKGRTRFNNADTGRWGNRSYPRSSDVASMDGENRMHLQLNAHEGKKFKVKKSGKNLTTGGNWDKNEQTIQIFDAGSKKPNGGKRAVDWIWEHELSHSHYDYLGDAINNGKLKDKVDAYKTFNEEAKKVDAGIIKKLMGSYASDYVVAHENGEPKGKSVETEMYAGFTDVRYQKIHDEGMQMESYKAWHELARTYPKLMKAFEKLSGEGVGDTALSNVFSQENIGKSSSEIHDTETIGIDIGRNIVDFDMADYIIEKGYNEIGKLVSVKTLFPESVKAEEEFVEQEHPRDGDGKFSNKGQKSGKKTKAQKRKEYDEQEKFMDKKPEKLTSEQQYEQLLDAFGGDRKELVGKSWLLPTGQVIQPDRARDDGGKYAWHNDWIKSTGCDDCIKIRADTTREFDPKGELAHLHISGSFIPYSQRRGGISEKQLDMVIEFIKKWKLDSDDVQIDDDTNGVVHEQINGRISGFSRNRSEFAQRIAQRNKMGEAFVEQEHPRDGDGKFTDKGGGSTQRGKQEKPTYKKQKSNIDVGYISKKVITKYPQLPKDFVDQQIHESIELRENAGMANKELQNNLNKNLEGVIISGRVKEIESMVGKLARQPENFNTVADLHDVSGVRVMADNLDGINSSLKYIKDNYNVVEEKDNVEDHRDGYRGYHAIIEDESGVKSEIQIRTKTQDVWAKYVHERVYKPKNNKVKKYVNDNKETITSYIIGMSDYFHNSEKGVSIEKPDCPEELEIELGCMQ